MSSAVEIEDAIAQLPASEREALELRVLARRFQKDVAETEEYRGLLASLDHAEQEIEGGMGHSAESLKADVRQWARE